MDSRTTGIYRFGIIDKVSLPASTNELPAYEAVHTMLRTLEVCFSLTPLLIYLSYRAYQFNFTASIEQANRLLYGT